MLKKKRGISLLIALTFLLSLLLPVGVALADTTYGDYSGAYRYVTSGENQAAGQITVTEKDNTKWDADEVYVKVTLPDGVTYQDKPTAATYGGYIELTNVAAGQSSFEDSAPNMLQIKLTDASNDGVAASVKFNFGNDASDLKIDSSVTGDIKATIEIMGLTGNSIAWVEEGSVTIAKVQAKDVTVTAASAKTVQVGTNKDAADVTLQETFPGALADDEEIFAQIETPNVKFNNAATTWTPTRIELDNAGVGVAVPGALVAGSDNRLLKVTVTTVSAGLAGKIVLDPKLDVPPSVSGDIQITIYSGKSGSKLKTTTVTVATVGEALVNIVDIKQTSGTVYAGHVKTLDANFKLKAASGNIPANKVVSLELSGATFAAAPNLGGAAMTLYNNNKNAWLETGANPGTELKVDNFKVKVAGDAAEGDIVVKVGGTAGASGEVVIAKAVKPFTVTADAPKIQIGQAQAAGDLIIKEAAAGAIIDDLRVKLPDGISFEGTPSKSVTSGNIQIGSLSVDPDTGALKIPVTTKSGIASTVKISGIKYNVNRLALDGNVEVKISGIMDDTNNDGRPDSDNTWQDEKVLAKVANAVVVSEAAGPAPATFTIGSTSYKVGDASQNMDVAPFIENGRTYLPVRYVAYAVGVSEDNIMWDGATATATLIKGDRVVQLTINSNKMLLNGATITMDVPAKMVSGRTMLPIRWVASALGCQVDWDAATNTVTVTQ